MTIQELHQIVESHYAEIQALDKIENFYDYEKTFVSIWREMGRSVLEKNISELPNDKRKKKPYNSGICNNK